MRPRALAKLSETLEHLPDPVVRRTVIRLYGDYVRTLRTFNRRSSEEEAIIADYNTVKQRYRMNTPDIDPSTQETTQRSETIREDEQRVRSTPTTMSGDSSANAGDLLVQALQPYLASASNRVNLNELVVRPEPFNGYTPKPRDWIETYEEAFQANEWSGQTAIKYFPTFLRGAALDWYKCMVRPKLPSIRDWEDLKQAFQRHYLGKDELRARRQELAAITQGPREPAINFIPRVLKMIQQAYPRMEEEDAVDRIMSKLRPETLKNLPLDGLDSIEDLVASACKVESRERQVEERTRKNRQYNQRQPTREYGAQRQGDSSTRPDNARQPQTPTAPSTDEKRNTGMGKGIQCYRCKRLGHIGRDCKETKAIDGRPVRLPKSKDDNPNQVRAIQTGRLVLNAGAQFEDKVLVIDECKPQVSRQTLFQKIRCNGLELCGLIDTGSFHSVLDESVAREHGWNIEGPVPALGAAGNNALNCVGTCEIEFELTLGRRTRCLTYHVAVVSNLGLNLIIGYEFLAITKLIVDAEAGQLYFKKPSLAEKPATGIRNTEKLILAPRTQNVVEARASVVGTILAVPNTLDNGLIIGNSVSAVKNDTVHMIVTNPLETPVEIEKGTQLATYELLQEENVEHPVCRVVELENFDETIAVGEELDDAQIQQISKLLHDNRDAFSQKGQIGQIKDSRFFHKIELLPESKPFNEQLRRRPQVHVEETRRQVRKMLDEGIIEESDSPWSSAYLLVRKKSGEYRLCIDFRRLNAQTKKFVYPLPNIEDCIDTLSGNKFFSLLDFSSGFHQLPLDSASKELTAFKTEDGLFHYTRMPFGLANAPASFQKMVNATLAGLRGVNLQIFIDDICIASQTWEEHIRMLSKVFQIITKSNLKLKASKCMFGARRVLFLGHIISESGVRQDPAKTKALLEMPRPKDAAGVRRVLGMLGYYRKFIPNFAAISEPLTKLLKKNQAFVWKEPEECAFRTLLAELAKDIDLAHFNHTDPIVVKTDASKAGVAALLLQRQNGVWRLIVCCSRRLNEHEQNYGISELEALAVIYACTKLRSFILGKHVQILTDHSALTVLNDKMPSSARLKRWALILQEFDYKLVYTKGQLQADVDCFSRAPIDPPDEFIERRIFHIVTPFDSDDWAAQYSDEDSKRYLELARSGSEKFALKNGIVYFEGRLYVPPAKRHAIVDEAHRSLVSCHGGVLATSKLLDQYWWPNMAETIRTIVAACGACQARKVPTTKQAGTMRSFQVYNAGDLVAVDYLGPLTETLSGKRHVVVAIDCFTRYIHARALPDKSADGFADFLLEYTGIFGAPIRLLSDNALSFKSKKVKSIEELLGVTHVWSTAEHSQGNAVAERALQSLQNKLNLVLKQSELSEECWDAALPMAVLGLNTSHHKSLGYTPYEMLFGRPHKTISKLVEQSARNPNDAHVELLRRQLEELRSNAVSTQSDAQATSKITHDEHHKPTSFAVGDLVQVRARPRRSKLADKFDKIAEVVSRDQDIYKLLDVKSRQELTRHISKLKRHLSTVNIIFDLKARLDINPTQDATMNTVQKQRVGVAILLLLYSQTAVSLFEMAGFVAWKATTINALMPKQEFEVKFMFDNPCKALRGCFPDAFNESKEISYADHKKCDKYYFDKIMVEMGWLAERYQAKVRRMTRGIPLLGLVGGIWLSNIVDSIFHDNDEIAKKEGGQNALLFALNDRMNFTTQALADLALHQKISMTQLNTILSQTDENTRTLHRLQTATSFILRRIEEKQAAILALRFGLINRNELDLQALNRLLDTNHFENIDSKTIEFHSLDWNNDATLTLRFWGHSINQAVKVYAVKTLPHWVNVTQGLASFIEYTGPKFVMANAEKNCVAGIESLDADQLALGCDEINGRSGDLEAWRTVKQGNPFTDITPTRHIEILPDIWVYCLGHNYRVKNGTWDECPAHAFKLRATTGWQTEDKTFIGIARSSLTFNMSTNLPDGMSPDEIQEPITHRIKETDALRRVYNLTRQLEIEHEKNFLLHTPVGGVSHAVMNKILWIGLVCCAILLIWTIRHNHLNIKKNRSKTVTHLQEIMKKMLNQGEYPELPIEDAVEVAAKKEQYIRRFLKSYIPKPASIATPSNTTDSSMA